MAQIPLTRGLVALVDDEDLKDLAANKWLATQSKPGRFYAMRFLPRSESDGKQVVMMHRQILGVTDKAQWVDHINGNSLDNRRANLRLCTPAENSRNRRKHSSNQSGFKGVFYFKKQRLYLARLCFDGKHIYLGYFKDPSKAAKAYDAGAKKYFGEFAKTNF